MSNYSAIASSIRILKKPKYWVDKAAMEQGQDIDTSVIKSQPVVPDEDNQQIANESWKLQDQANDIPYYILSLFGIIDNDNQQNPFDDRWIIKIDLLTDEGVEEITLPPFVFDAESVVESDE